MAIKHITIILNASIELARTGEICWETERKEVNMTFSTLFFDSIDLISKLARNQKVHSNYFFQ